MRLPLIAAPRWTLGFSVASFTVFSVSCVALFTNLSTFFVPFEQAFNNPEDTFSIAFPLIALISTGQSTTAANTTTTTITFLINDFMISNIYVNNKNFITNTIIAMIIRIYRHPTKLNSGSGSFVTLCLGVVLLSFEER